MVAAVVLMMAHYLGDTESRFPLVFPFPDSLLEIHVRTSVLSIFHYSVYIERLLYTPTTSIFLEIEKHLDRSIFVPLRRSDRFSL